MILKCKKKLPPWQERLFLNFMETPGKSTMLKNAPKSALQSPRSVKLRCVTHFYMIFTRYSCHILKLVLNCELQNNLNCKKLLFGSAIQDCQNLVDVESFVDICIKDMCSSCNSSACICSTISEYFHQCVHAGGKPGAWRTPNLCGKQSSHISSLYLFHNHCSWHSDCVCCGTEKECPFHMEYSECGTACPEVCSLPQSSQVCTEQCVDGCFCPAGKSLRCNLQRLKN